MLRAPLYYSFAAASLTKVSSKVALVVNNLPTQAGDPRDVGSITGLGRSPGGGHSNPFQDSCLENLMGTWTEEYGGLQSIGLQTAGHN